MPRQTGEVEANAPKWACRLRQDGEFWVCDRCGVSTKRVTERAPMRVCRANGPEGSVSDRATTANARKLILHCGLSPGDILTMTAAIESLHATYPGEYLTDADTPCPDIFRNNPHVTDLRKKKKAGPCPGCPEQENPAADAETIEMHYPSVHQSNQRLMPFLAGYTEFLGEAIGRQLKLTTNRPHLYLTDEEIVAPLPAELEPNSYWLVNAGVKNDFPLKQWPVEHYQAVVDAMQGSVRFAQIGEKHRDHHHFPLAGVANLIGKTSLRDLIRLAHHAIGGVGPVTFLQHLCAAWQKPYVCIAGGREPVGWIAYPKQTTLHTIGALDCCRNGACWKSTLADCARPLLAGNGRVRGVGRCMAMIEPDEVISVLRRYLREAESPNAAIKAT